MIFTRHRFAVGSWGLFLSLVLAGGCGDSAHTLGSTGDGGHGGGSAGAAGATSQGGAGGSGSGGSVAGHGGMSGAVGTGGAGATAGAAGGGGGGAGAGGASGGAGKGGAGAGTGGAGAGAGTAGGGRGGSGGGAGAVAGRGGSGGTGGSGNAGGSAAGTTGRGGMGGGGTGGTFVTGTGGVPVVACISVQTLDRSCTTDADCFVAQNIADCCGRQQYIGLRTTAQAQYTTLEAQCKSEWPACTCATGATTTDDGSSTRTGTAVGVACRQNVCTTFVSACGGPCATGTTCFSCSVVNTTYAACTTTCTDVSASSDCKNTALPRCQIGTSGNVSGTYCTAANIMCDTKSSTSLSDCTGFTCASTEQVVNVRNPALGTTQCGCAALPSAGTCTDCTCGEALCTPYGAHCSGYAADKGLLCSLPG